jgi:hypothetical protein
MFYDRHLLFTNFYGASYVKLKTKQILNHFMVRGSKQKHGMRRKWIEEHLTQKL